MAEEVLKFETGEGETLDVDYDKEANPDELKISTVKKKEKKKKDTTAEKPENN